LKIVTVVGARPQFIKAAAVSRELQRCGGVTELLLHTGQHYDKMMSQVFFDELEIPTPTYHLQVGSGLHGDQTGRMLHGIEKVLVSERPDLVIVYGDTNSTLAGALAAAKLHVPVAHVEAGLRSFNRRMPEEVNRVLTDHASELLFAPSPTSVENLAQEGIPDEKVHLVGDVMYDAVLHLTRNDASLARSLEYLEVPKEDFLLATVHRAENTDDPVRLQVIFDALRHLARDCPVLVPLHPRTRAALERASLLEGVEHHIRLLPPLSYRTMVALEHAASIVLTDSGGVQKEAYFCGTPCVILRDETEWVELLEFGSSVLCPPLSIDAIVACVRQVRGVVPPHTNLYGGGMAAQRIVSILEYA
jgi:UDP-GlcNAc3NAcA epimerase